MCLMKKMNKFGLVSATILIVALFFFPVISSVSYFSHRIEIVPECLMFRDVYSIFGIDLIEKKRPQKYDFLCQDEKDYNWETVAVYELFQRVSPNFKFSSVPADLRIIEIYVASNKVGDDRANDLVETYRSVVRSLSDREDFLNSLRFNQELNPQANQMNGKRHAKHRD